MTARVRWHHWFSMLVIAALLLGACVQNGAPAAGEPAAAQPAGAQAATAALPEGAASGRFAPCPPPALRAPPLPAQNAQPT